MRSLNKVMLIGNLTREPEVRETTTGQKVATFSVATNRYWKDANGNQNEETEYHDAVAWGKLAEICQAYLKTGTAIYLEGRLKTRSWEGQDGHKRYKTEIIVADLNILSRKRDSDTPSTSDSSSEAPVKNEKSDDQSAPKEPTADTSNPSEEDSISIEDIPF